MENSKFREMCLSLINAHKINVSSFVFALQWYCPHDNENMMMGNIKTPGSALFEHSRMSQHIIVSAVAKTNSVQNAIG